MSQHMQYMMGDKVYYLGQKFRNELLKEGKSLTGWVHATVEGDPDKYIIWFPETKHQDSYIMHSSSLTMARPPVGKRDDGPEIAPRRRKKSEED